LRLSTTLARVVRLRLTELLARLAWLLLLAPTAPPRTARPALSLTLTLTLALSLGLTLVGALTLFLLLIAALPLTLALAGVLTRLALWLEPAELSGELGDLALLLIDLGSELTMDLLQLALHSLGVAIRLATSPRAFNRTVALTFASRAVGRVRASAGAATVHLRLGPQLGQRERHVDPEIDQLVQLLLHLVQLLAALLQVPIDPLLVGVQSLVDLLGELASLSARELASLSAPILFGLLTGRSAPGLSQGHPRGEDRGSDHQ